MLKINFTEHTIFFINNVFQLCESEVLILIISTLYRFLTFYNKPKYLISVILLIYLKFKIKTR